MILAWCRWAATSWQLLSGVLQGQENELWTNAGRREQRGGGETILEHLKEAVQLVEVDSTQQQQQTIVGVLPRRAQVGCLRVDNGGALD